ncbi:MAG: DUF362 domain-containing protein [Acidobacteriota bacterium]|nr:DUF362 domain-containing protein [Acidobacteriota bacterium]
MSRLVFSRAANVVCAKLRFFVINIVGQFSKLILELASGEIVPRPAPILDADVIINVPKAKTHH